MVNLFKITVVALHLVRHIASRTFTVNGTYHEARRPSLTVRYPSCILMHITRKPCDTNSRRSLGCIYYSVVMGQDETVLS